MHEDRHIPITLGNVFTILILSTLGNSALAWGSSLGANSKIGLVKNVSLGIQYVIHGA